MICTLLLATACGNADGTVADSTDRRLDLVPELRLGSLDDPETALTFFRELTVGPDGRIYTVHRQENLIRIHDPTGRPAGTIGRAGDGPGEFRGVSRMGWVGDTLWVLDTRFYRFSFFDADGTLLREQSIPIDLGSSPTHSPPRPDGLLPDGSIYGSSPAWSSEVASGNLTQQAVLRLDERSNPLDTLYVRSLANTTWAIEDPRSSNGFGSYSSQPFSDTEIVLLSPTELELFRIDRAVPSDPAAARIRVSRITLAGDTVFSREYPYQPIELDRAHPDSLIRMRGEQMAEIADRMPGAPTPARAEELARESLYLPAYYPPVSQARIGRDGSVWLKREAVPGDSTDWLLLSPTGDVFGSVAIPTEFQLLAADSMRIWGMETDELDVPYLAQYRVTTDATPTASRSARAPRSLLPAHPR